MLIFDPEPQPITSDALCERVEALTFEGIEPFSATVLDFLDGLSRRLLKSSEAAVYPQLTSLGFWLRRAAVSRMKERFLAGSLGDAVLSPRGVALHLPPANVDTLFVYSWALSLLAGNANVVRLPTTLSEVTKFLVHAIIEGLKESADDRRHLFCNYPFDSDQNARLSLLSDLRMVWGGDEKVGTVSTLPTRPDGLSLGFPNRRSYSAISSSTYAALGNAMRDTLAQKFYNDMFWFDQMGCSSPRILYWVGKAKANWQDFSQRLATIAAIKNYEVETGVVIDKFFHMNAMLADKTADTGHRYSNALYVMTAEEGAGDRNHSIGGGFLTMVQVDTLTDIAKYATRKDQTISHFGFEGAALTDLARALRGRGGYRIVPVGTALNFDAVWDGVDLMRHMTRQILIVTGS